VIREAKDEFFQAIVSTLNGIEIPDFDDGHGNYMTGNSFHIKECTNDVHMDVDEKHNTFILDNKKVTAQFKSKKFRYKVAPLIVAKGHAEVDLNQIEIRVGDEFLTQVLHDKHIVPKVKARDVKVKINRHNIKIHLHGDFISDVAGFFSWFFKGTVANAIEEACYGILNDSIPKATNNFLAKTDGVFGVPFINDWALDWQTPQKA